MRCRACNALMSDQEIIVDDQYCLDCRIASTQEYSYVSDKEYSFGWDGLVGGFHPPKSDQIEY